MKLVITYDDGTIQEIPNFIELVKEVGGGNGIIIKTLAGYRTIRNGIANYLDVDSISPIIQPDWIIPIVSIEEKED